MGAKLFQRKAWAIVLAFAVASVCAICGCQVTVNIGTDAASSSATAESANASTSAASNANANAGSNATGNDNSSQPATSNTQTYGTSDESDASDPTTENYESDSSPGAKASGKAGDISVTENGTYNDKDHVALYIHEFGHLPSNYISKTKARKAGWVADKGNLQDVLPGKSIGGSEFYNDEGLLPDAKGRRWTECDIDYEGGFRNAKRIVFSNDGLVFYTDDHYKTFEQLY